MAKWKMLDRDRMDGLRGADEDSSGEFDQDGNQASSPTTPLAFNGSPGRRSRESSYVRSQSLNGRIQKPNAGRSQSFNAKCSKLPHRSYHMDTLQAQLLYMKANGVDQKKFINVLQKLKDMYLARGDQQQQQEDRRTPRHSLPSSPLSNNQIPSHSSPLSSYQMPPSSPLSNYQMPPSSPLTNSGQITSSPLSNHLTSSSSRTSSQAFPHRIEDRPASTIALLKNKFAQLERYKESIQGQQIQVYPNQTFHSGHSSAQRTPVSSTPCSPSVGLEDAYYFDEGTAALLAMQQEMMSNASRSAAAGQAASGISEDAMTSDQSRGSRSPGWSASACDSPVSSSMSPQSDEAANALLHYMLQPPNGSQHPPRSNVNSFQQMGLSAGANSNLNAFQNMSLGGGGGAAAMGHCNKNNVGSGGMTDSLGGLLAAERMEIMMAKKAAATAGTNNVTHETNTKLASSIQHVVAKFPFNLTAKFTSPKSRLPAPSWGKGLSLHTAPPRAQVAPIVVPSEDDYLGERSCESESPSPQQTYCSDLRWYNNISQRESSKGMFMKYQEELVDTSLHL